jgi:hypothetical protein
MPLVVESNSVDQRDTRDFELPLEAEVLLDVALTGSPARIFTARRPFIDHDPDRRAGPLWAALQKRLDEPIRLRRPVGERVRKLRPSSTREATVSVKVPTVRPALPGKNSSLDSELCDVVGTEKRAVSDVEIWRRTRDRGRLW